MNEQELEIKTMMENYGFHVSAEDIEKIKEGMKDIEELEKEAHVEMMRIITNAGKKAKNLKIEAIFFVKILGSMKETIQLIQKGVIDEIMLAKAVKGKKIV